MANELHGKFALVTGGSRGIGAATAKQLAAQGATVIVNYAGNKSAAESVVAEITSLGVKAIAVQADMSDEAGVARLFAAGSTASYLTGVMLTVDGGFNA